MFANCTRAVAVLCCVAAFACDPALADDVKPMKPPVPPGVSDKKLPAKPQVPKFPTVIPLEILDAGEAAATLAKGGFAQLAVLVPLPEEKALLVYADAKTTKEIKNLLRQLGEPFTAPKKPHVIRLIEGFDTEDAAKTLRKLFPAGTVIVPLPAESALLVYVTDAQAKEIRVLLGKALAAEPEKPAAEKKFTIKFKDAKWDDVFSAYEKLTGLKATINSKPKGTFTFTPPKADQQVTLAEITDIINDALLAKNHLLIRRHMTFVVVPADEKVDPTLVPRISLDELGKRGRTELVQVIIPLEGLVAEDLPLDELKKMLSPFGSVLPGRSAWVLVTDTAGNVAKIKKRIDELCEPKPEKK